MEDFDAYEGRSVNFEHVFFAVDIQSGEHTADEKEEELIGHVSKLLQENTRNENVLVVLLRRPDKLQLAEAISTYIENMAKDGFETALTLLKKYVTRNRPRLSETFSTFFVKRPVEKCLQMLFYDYDTSNEKTAVRRVPMENLTARIGHPHIADHVEVAAGGSAEQPEKHVKKDERIENAEKDKEVGGLIDNDVLYTLAGQIKCSVIVEYFSCKYNLPPWIVNDILELKNFKEQFVKSVSSKTKGFIFHYVEQTKKGVFGLNHRVSVLVKRGKKRRITSQRVSFKLLVSKVAHDIQGLVDDYEGTMSNISVFLRKLTFEIEGYLLHEDDTKQESCNPPPPTIPPEIKKSRNFVRNDTEYIGLGEPFGTIEGFVQRDRELHMRSCQHVVGSKSIVTVQKPGGVPKCVIGRATPNMSIKSGTHGAIDIAAVKVVRDVRNRCIPKYKDSDGIFRTSVLYDSETKGLRPGSNVFKYGASTGLTGGIVASSDFDVDISNSLVFIESKADFSPRYSSTFNGPGDSGALILRETFEGTNQRPTLQIISLLSGGLQESCHSMMQELRHMITCTGEPNWLELARPEFLVGSN